MVNLSASRPILLMQINIFTATSNNNSWLVETCSVKLNNLPYDKYVNNFMCSILHI